MRYFLWLALIFFPVAASAETISCPGKIDNVLMEEEWPSATHDGNQKNTFPVFIQQDIGGDYDEMAQQEEWNELNSNKNYRHFIAHCFVEKGDKTSIDIKISSTIRRCIFHGHQFFCTSDSIACPGYVDDAVVQKKSIKGALQDLSPDVEREDGKTKEWHNINIARGESLTAICPGYPVNSFRNYTKMQIPGDMKNCRLENRRFICSVRE